MAVTLRPRYPRSTWRPHPIHTLASDRTPCIPSPATAPHTYPRQGAAHTYLASDRTPYIPSPRRSPSLAVCMFHLAACMMQTTTTRARAARLQLLQLRSACTVVCMFIVVSRLLYTAHRSRYAQPPPSHRRIAISDCSERRLAGPRRVSHPVGLHGWLFCWPSRL